MPTVSGTVPQRTHESSPPVTFVDSTVVPKSRVGPTPIKPKTSIEHLQALTNATNQESIREEPKIKQEQDETKVIEEGGAGEEESGEKSESPPKKNLWWLKKKRRKRTRLTYIKTKYRRKEDEGAPSTSEVAPMQMEMEMVGDPELDMEDGLATSPLGDRPKRGRPPKGVGFRFKAESFSNSDPDWDETEERRRVKPVVKKKKGRVKRGDGF